MRYGLNRVFHLAYGVAELSPRTLTSSVGSINSGNPSNHSTVRSSAEARRSVSSSSSSSSFHPHFHSSSLLQSSPSFSPPSSLFSSPPFSPSPLALNPDPLFGSKILLSSSSTSVQSPWMSHSISSFSSSRSSHLTRLFSLPVRHFSVSSHLFSADDKRPSSSVKDDSSPDKKPDDANNSAEKKPDDANNSAEKKPDDANNSALINTNGLYKRFHKAYKNYGKVLIGFHSVTYCVYFTSFLGISYGGLDVVVVLEWLRDHVGFPQAIIDKLHSSGAGHFAVAFILCKVITPIRYLTTLVGTKYTADYLRRRGYMAPVPKGDNIGELAKESQKLIETKSAEIKTKFAKGRRSGEARMRKTNTAVKDKLKRTPKR